MNYDYSELRNRVIEAAGDTPSEALETRIVEVFRRHPAAVVQGVEHVLHEYERGTIRSPWGVLAVHVEKLAAQIERASDIAVTDSDKQRRAHVVARQWMHSVGIHYDRWAEVEDELRNGFTSGMTGGLKLTDEEALSEMYALWQELRPIGERIEQEAIERARVRTEQRRAILAAAKPAPLPEPEPERQLVTTTGNPFL